MRKKRKRQGGKPRKPSGGGAAEAKAERDRQKKEAVSNIIDCESVRLSEGTIRGLLGSQLHRFGAGSRVYDPLKEEYADVSKAEVQIKPDPKDGNQFRLHINGKNIFQRFKDLWQSLRQTLSRGIPR